MKHAVAVLAPYWGDTLTEAQRIAWDLYGANVVMTNVLGQPFHLTGQNHFLRANIPRIQSGISLLETAPTVFDLGTFTAPTLFDSKVAPPSFKIGFSQTDDWATTIGAFMLIYEGRQASPGRSYFGGPYRFVSRIDGDVPFAVSPKQFTTVWGMGLGNLVWAQIRVIQLDGRLSLPVTLGPDTVVAM